MATMATCRNCSAPFDIRAASLRPNRASPGGSDHPAIFVVPLALVLAGWLGARALLGELAPLIDGAGAVLAGVVLVAIIVAYTDTYNAACPHCGWGGHTRWPWSR